jgi:hypothetical protein
MSLNILDRYSKRMTTTGHLSTGMLKELEWHGDHGINKIYKSWKHFTIDVLVSSQVNASKRT